MFSKKTSAVRLISNLEHQFLTACREGNYTEVQKMLITLKNFNLVSLQDLNGNTPLHLAIRGGHLQVIELLLQNDADKYVKNDYKFTPLNIACQRIEARTNPNYPSSLEIFDKTLKLLIKYNLNINLAEKSNSNLTKFALVGEIDAIKILFAHGMDINTRDQFGNTPLHYTAIKNHYVKQQIEVAKWLVENGADVNALNNHNELPFHIALNGKHNEILTVLVPCPKEVRVSAKL